VGFCASRTGTWASSKSAERYARETKKPPCSVAEAGRIASKRSVTVGSVLFAVVAKERASAMGCVSDASRVAIERLITAGRVDEAGRIAIERLNTIGRVAIAFGVEKERGVTGRRIIAGRVAVERGLTVGRVVAATNVAGERISANGIVVPSSRVSIERVNTNGVVVCCRRYPRILSAITSRSIRKLSWMKRTLLPSAWFQRTGISRMRNPARCAR
jgi:hypothetical protein